jgi:hypothetical protein
MLPGAWDALQARGQSAAFFEHITLQELGAI